MSDEWMPVVWLPASTVMAKKVVKRSAIASIPSETYIVAGILGVGVGLFTWGAIKLCKEAEEE